MDLKLTYREVGTRVELHAWGREDGQGLYKAYLKGATGRVLLGTLIPDGNCLHLRRTLSKEELRRQGAWPIQGWEAVLAYSFQRADPPEGWNWLDQPESLFGTREPSIYLKEVEAIIYRKEGEQIRLAVPYQPDKPYPLSAYFCFSVIAPIANQKYAMISFARQV